MTQAMTSLNSKNDKDYVTKWEMNSQAPIAKEKYPIIKNIGATSPSSYIIFFISRLSLSDHKLNQLQSCVTP